MPDRKLGRHMGKSEAQLMGILIPVLVVLAIVVLAIWIVGRANA